MTISCPKCASRDGRSIEAIYCECANGEIPRTLTRESAPPAARRPTAWLAMTFWFVILSVNTRGETTLALITCALLSAWMARDAIRYNRADLPRLTEYWHRSFMCTRCGEVFVPA